MIEELRIASLGVIEEAVLELGPGLSVITGETGAGKTMVVTALGLLLGGRADAAAVRSGASTARVEGLVRLAGSSESMAASVDELGGAVEDDAVLLARQISAEGRSRAYVGGASVPANVLAGLTESLVAVHGQSDQHRLLRPGAQRDALDRFAGGEAVALLEDYRSTRAALRATEAELAELVSGRRERAREADLLRFGLAEVEQVAPQPGEDLLLAAEEERLSFSDALRRAAEQSRELLSSQEGGADALAAVSAARSLLDGVRTHDPAVSELADRLAEVGYLLADVTSDISSYAAGLDTDPARLAAVSERRAALTALTRKYGESVDEVLVWSADAARRLLEVDNTDTMLEQLRERRAALRAHLGGVGTSLSSVRQAAAVRLGETVTAELAGLAMQHAQLRVMVTQPPDDSEDAVEVDGRRLRIGASGFDEVELQLAANRGARVRPLNRGASGGELSRVMLALEVALAGTSPVPTFVFDEVDAGVGGKAAVEVGRRLAELARSAQVVVVTHLPQVAAFADDHHVVVKSLSGAVTTADVRRLDDAGRVRELSRMLAGMEDSDTALAHASELLAAARGTVTDGGSPAR